jgi:hypothetical protein
MMNSGNAHIHTPFAAPFISLLNSKQGFNFYITMTSYKKIKHSRREVEKLYGTKKKPLIVTEMKNASHTVFQG